MGIGAGTIADLEACGWFVVVGAGTITSLEACGWFVVVGAGTIGDLEADGFDGEMFETRAVGTTGVVGADAVVVDVTVSGHVQYSGIFLFTYFSIDGYSRFRNVLTSWVVDYKM